MNLNVDNVNVHEHKMNAKTGSSKTVLKNRQIGASIPCEAEIDMVITVKVDNEVIKLQGKTVQYTTVQFCNGSLYNTMLYCTNSHRRDLDSGSLKHKLDYKVNLYNSEHIIETFSMTKDHWVNFHRRQVESVVISYNTEKISQSRIKSKDKNFQNFHMRVYCLKSPNSHWGQVDTNPTANTFQQDFKSKVETSVHMISPSSTLLNIGVPSYPPPPPPTGSTGSIVPNKGTNQ